MGHGRASLLTTLIVALLLALFGGSAQASLTVANTNDSGPGSLRQTVAEAPPGETVRLPAGEYVLTSAGLTIARDVNIAGHGSNDTTIRAAGAFSVITVEPSLEVTIGDLTIRGGHATGGIATGGGISTVNSELTLRRVVLTENTADASGAPGNSGGIAEGGGLHAVGGLVTVSESTFAGNRALADGGSGKGGGIADGGGLSVIGSLRMSDSTVRANFSSAEGGQGPASSNQSGGIADAGGLFLVQNSGPASTVVRSTFSSNTVDASGGPGGPNGIAQGGGLFTIENEAPMTFDRLTIAGNVARTLAPTSGIVQGGGQFASGNAAAGVSLANATIARNAVEGGSISTGGNLFRGGKVTLLNSVIAYGAGSPGSQDCSGPVTSLGFNLDTTDQCGLSGPGDLPGRDPLLGPLQDNGGPTETMLPAAGSPLVDQGSAGSAVSWTDQRGVVRPIDFPSIANPAVPGADGSDIGAAELQPSNAIALGKLVKNKKKGTATLQVSIPTPSAGALEMSGAGLKPQSVAIAGQSSVLLTLRATGGAAKKLRKKGKLRTAVEVTYAPTGNVPATVGRNVALVRKHKKHGRHRGHHHRRG